MFAQRLVTPCQAAHKIVATLSVDGAGTDLYLEHKSQQESP